MTETTNTHSKYEYSVRYKTSIPANKLPATSCSRALHIRDRVPHNLFLFFVQLPTAQLVQQIWHTPVPIDVSVQAGRHVWRNHLGISEVQCIEHSVMTPQKIFLVVTAFFRKKRNERVWNETFFLQNNFFNGHSDIVFKIPENLKTI